VVIAVSLAFFHHIKAGFLKPFPHLRQRGVIVVNAMVGQLAIDDG
jgi:hypothetical protein